MLTLWLSDVRAHLDDSSGRLALVRGPIHAGARACFWIRLALVVPLPLYLLCRAHLLAAFGIDVTQGARIGGGLRLPHPLGIVIGSGARIGESVTLYHNVTIGDKDGYPEIGDRVVVWPGAVVVGQVHVGSGAVVGANTFLDRDLEPGAVWRGSG